MYASQSRPDARANQVKSAVLLDPSLMRAARQIYRGYLETHPDRGQRPLGVVIDRQSQRGRLIFMRKPILLPLESFVPINQLETDPR